MSKLVSFGKFKKRMLLGLTRSATPSEIKQIIELIQNVNVQMNAREEWLMNEAIRKETSSIKQIELKNFFSEIRKVRSRYEIDALDQLSEMKTNPSKHSFIQITPAGEVELLDRVGDNCYEYALNDYYECKLLGINPVFRDIQWVPAKVRAQLPFFLAPGFTFEWPLYVENQDGWEERYGNCMLTQQGMVQALQYDAAAFGLTCRSVEFNPQSYVHPEGTTLICAIRGEVMLPDGTLDPDYHFYRYHPKYKLWSHKMGMSPVTCFDTNGKLIDHPAQCATIYNRSSVLGFFQINII